MARYEAKNPFLDDEEDDDDYWYGNKGKYSGGGVDKPKTRYEELQEQKQNSVNRTRESTQRALASVYESETIGVSTAEELSCQGEQLDNVERKVTKINQDMRTSQKHINNIKSVFGGLKNWWQGRKEEPLVEENTPPRKLDSKLTTAIDRQKESKNHPALRLRSEDYKGFYNDSEETSSSKGKYSPQSQQQGFKASRFEDDEDVDENLDLLSGGLGRLKDLAKGLGGEIDKQNDQVERITQIVDRGNIKITDQNRQMRGILHK